MYSCNFYGGCIKNSICARAIVNVSLIEAYNSLHQYDVIALSEAMLNGKISNEDIYIEGFSREIYGSAHPNDSEVGGVCLYF